MKKPSKRQKNSLRKDEILNRKIITLLDFVLTFAFYWIFSVGAHELFHTQVAHSLGYQSYAYYPNLFSGYATIEPFPTSGVDIFLISIAGGGLVALFFFIISYFTDDWETKTVLWFFFPLHGSYCIMEALYMFKLISISVLATAPTIIALIVVVIKLRTQGYI